MERNKAVKARDAEEEKETKTAKAKDNQPNASQFARLLKPK